MNIKSKLVDSKGNELPPDIQIEKLSPSLQPFLRLLVAEIFTEDMNALKAKNKASKAKKKSQKQTKGSTSDPSKKRSH